MINDKRIAKETERLLHLPFPPSTREAQEAHLKEYSRILRERAESLEHLTAIVDYLMNTCKRCPPPAEVLEAAMEIRPPTKTKAPLGCEKCQGSGYVHYTVKVSPISAVPYDAEYSKPCDCALGQFIQPEYDRRKNRIPGTAEELR